MGCRVNIRILMATAEEIKQSPGSVSKLEGGGLNEQGPQTSQMQGMEDATSPFRLPSDEEVFVTKEAEKRRLQEQKEKQQRLKIWEKKTVSTHAGLKRPKETDIPAAERPEEAGDKKAEGKKKELIQAALDIVKGRMRGGAGKELGEKKMGMQDFVDQKKEMFLVAKTTGILEKERDNLEKLAKERENALALYFYILG